MRDRDSNLAFVLENFIVYRDDNTHKFDSSFISVDLEETVLREGEKTKFKEYIEEFSEVFSDKPGLTRVAWHRLIRMMWLSKRIGITRLSKISELS